MTIVKTIAGTAGFVWLLASAYGAVQFLEIVMMVTQ